MPRWRGFAFGFASGYGDAPTMNASPSPMGLAPILAGLALLVAGGHLAYALTRGAPAAPSPIAAGGDGAASECRCDDAALRAEIADLRRALRTLEDAALTRPAASRLPTDVASPRAAAPVPPSKEELAAALPADSKLPAIKLFVGIPDGLELSQRPDGTVEAKATRPELVGEEFLIYILTEQDETKAIRARAQ